MARRALPLALVGVLVVSPAVAAMGATTPVDRITQYDRWFTGADGRVMLLHGGNVSLPDFAQPAPVDERWTAETPERMAAQGFDGVRLVVFLSGIMPKPGAIDPAYIERIAKAVAAYKKAGIHVLIDFHQDEYAALVGVRGMPDWAVFSDGNRRLPAVDFPMGYFKDPAVQRSFDNFWANHSAPGTGKGVQDLYVEALAAVARRFRNEPAVLGIDVMNEPATGSRCAEPDPAVANCPELEQQLLRPFYEKASRAIAEAAPAMIVFVEPFMLQGALGIPINTPIVAPHGRRGLSFHNYGPVEEMREKVSAGALAVAVNNQAAILNTEWGFSNDPAEVDRQANDFDRRLISWMAWPRGAFEALVDPALPDRGNGDREQILRAYARPYPAATAGTPIALSFDSASGTMRYRYTATLPDGKSAGPTLLTEVRIPAISYPNGYRVIVTGGSVTSQTDAPVLSIRNDPRAATVAVTVTRVGTLPPLASTGNPTGGSEAAALAALPPIPPGPLTRASLIGHIVATPGGRAVLDREVPGVLTGLSQVHGWEKMTLAGIQHFASGALTDAKLTDIDRALAGLKVTPRPINAPDGRLSIDSLTSDLLADPRAQAIIEHEAPGLVGAPQQALYPQTTLRHLQPAMPTVLTDGVLDRVEKALVALPPA